MRLSIIIPVYNVEPYVGKTLESIFDTTASSDDFEVIVVNDGTKDGAMEVVRQYVDSADWPWFDKIFFRRLEFVYERMRNNFKSLEFRLLRHRERLRRDGRLGKDGVTGYLFRTSDLCAALLRQVCHTTQEPIIRQAQHFVVDYMSVEACGPWVMEVYQAVS